MTWGLIINGVNYMCLMNDNNLKKKSLYDNVYFTLRDIWANANSFDICYDVNLWNDDLTGGISFEERTNHFQYTNKLHQKDYVEKLHKWLQKINIYYFEFQEPEEGEEIDMKEYMTFNDWWVQFEELRNLIDLQYEKCCRWEEEYAERDCDRLEEFTYDEDEDMN